MTDEQAAALGRRLIACERWRWLPGMLDEDGYRLVIKLPDGLWLWVRGEDRKRTSSGSGVGPDLRDAATRGAVLQLVREVIGPACSVALFKGSAVLVHGSMPVVVWREGSATAVSAAPTEAEALTVALESAP